MKYLKAPNGSPLTFPPLGGSKFMALDGIEHETGEVAETTEAWLKRAVAAALPKVTGAGPQPVDMEHPFRFCEASEIMRDMRWINKALAREGVAAGASGVGMRESGRGVGLDIPEGARPAEAPYEPKVGDNIAVGANISPKAMMNARGVVTRVNGTRVAVTLDAGDIRRVERATGKKFAAETTLPKQCVEAA